MRTLLIEYNHLSISIFFILFYSTRIYFVCHCFLSSCLSLSLSILVLLFCTMYTAYRHVYVVVLSLPFIRVTIAHMNNCRFFFSYLFFWGFSLPFFFCSVKRFVSHSVSIKNIARIKRFIISQSFTIMLII